MRTTRLTIGAAAGILAACTVLPAAEPPETNRAELREQLKRLPPEERQAKIQELREKYKVTGPLREEAEKRREEWKNLPPEERLEKMREWRAKRSGDAQDPRSFTPEEREARRKEIRSRLETQLGELRKKKAAGPLTPEEERRLQHMEQVAKHFERGFAGRPRPRPDGAPNHPQP